MSTITTQSADDVDVTMNVKTTKMTPGWDRKVSNHVPIAQTIRNCLTMAYRGILKVKHTPEQMFDVIIQPLLFTPMFAYLFGGAIGGSVEGYLPMLLPGIMVQTVLTASTVTGVQLREDMDKGVFDRFKSLPIARIAPLAGALIADTARYVVATALTMAIGFIMGWRPDGGFFNIAAAGLLVILTGWALSWIFAFFGVIARSAGSVQGIGMMILFPLTFASNAYVPVETLPSWLQTFVNINPVSHLVTAARDLCNHGTWGIDAVWAVVGIVVIVGVFAPLTVRAYMRKA